MRRDRAIIAILVCVFLAGACGSTSAGEARIQSEVVSGEALASPAVGTDTAEIAATSGTMFWFWAPW